MVLKHRIKESHSALQDDEENDWGNNADWDDNENHKIKEIGHSNKNGNIDKVVEELHKDDVLQNQDSTSKEDNDPAIDFDELQHHEYQFTFTTEIEEVQEEEEEDDYLIMPMNIVKCDTKHQENEETTHMQNSGNYNPVLMINHSDEPTKEDIKKPKWREKIERIAYKLSKLFLKKKDEVYKNFKHFKFKCHSTIQAKRKSRKREREVFEADLENYIALW